MTRVTFSRPGPVGRSQRVHISSLKTTTPFHWPLDVKAGQRFGLAASSLTCFTSTRGTTQTNHPAMGSRVLPSPVFLISNQAFNISSP